MGSAIIVTPPARALTALRSLRHCGVVKPYNAGFPVPLRDWRSRLLMLRFISSVPALFLGIALLIGGSMMLGTLLAVRLTAAGLGAGTIGAVLTCYSLGFVVGTRLGVPVIQRVGHIRSFAAFAALACASVLLHPVFLNAPFWALLRVITGFSMACLTLDIESWINGRATPRNRGNLLAIYMVTYYVAAAVGQYLVGLTHNASPLPFNLIAILVVLSLVPVTLTRVEAPALSSGERMRFRELYAACPTGLAGALVSGVVNSAFLAVGPVYARLVGLNVSQLSQYMAIAVLAAMVMQWPVGKLSDLYDRRRMLVGLAALTAIASVGAAWVGRLSVPGLFATSALFMGLSAAVYPISVALTNDYLSHDQVVPASSGLLLSNGMGTCVGPLVGSFVMQWFTPAALFFFIAACLALLAVFGLFRSRTTPDVPLEDQGSYVTMQAPSTPVIAELDPRSDAFDLGGEAPRPEASAGDPRREAVP